MKSTMKNKSEQEESNGNVNQTNNNDLNSNELKRIEEVEGTPFTVVKDNELYYILLGKYRLSEEYLIKEIAIQDAKTMNWNRIMQVIGVMIQEYKK